MFKDRMINAAEVVDGKVDETLREVVGNAALQLETEAGRPAGAIRTAIGFVQTAMHRD